jgi:arginine decarboxylase
MKIHITSGLGSGPTKLAAFDAALNRAGVSNYNLIRLSSIIPPESQLTIHDTGLDGAVLPGEWGDRLYVVMAEMRADIPGVEVWAGIGWVQDKKSGKGLFVEHEGASEEAVRRDITQSLETLMKTRGQELGTIQMKIAGCACTDQPVCALVVATYQAAGWQDYSGPHGA